ncbi:MAG: NRDE family protein [Burkholderiaceae bacterium]
MCLIAFALSRHPRWPVVVLANRDEWLGRPSAAAAWWPDREGCFGGRDLEAGGSWMLLQRAGRLAMLTNDPRLAREPGQRSRGELVVALANDPDPIEAAFAKLLDTDARYAGFQLLGIDWREGEPRAMVASNVPDTTGTSRPFSFAAGVHTLTNAPPDTPWRKALLLQGALADGLRNDGALPVADWLATLSSTQLPVHRGDVRSAGHVDDRTLPESAEARSPTPAGTVAAPGPARHKAAADIRRVPDAFQLPEPAGALMSPFVAAAEPSGYGTRVSSIVTVADDGLVRFDEWHWAAAASPPRWTRRIATRVGSPPAAASHASPR